MAFIEFKNISKEFKITRPEKSIIKSLFHREYEIKQAVNDVSFDIEKGEIVGYIGPNGAGKSTTIKILSGILTPTSGTATVGGIVPYENRRENNMRMGVVFGQRSQLYWDLPMRETFGLYKKMYRIDDVRFKQNLDFYIELLEMEDFLSTPVRQLSLGQKMRGNIAIALLHDPDIVYLDEPTIGLDVVAKSRIRDFIREVNREKKTTFILTTHDMSDIEAVCKRLIMIDKGRKLYDGTLSDFKATYSGGNVLIADFGDANEVVMFDPRLTISKREDSRYYITFRKEEISPMDALKAITENYKITDFMMRESDIEEIVKDIYAAEKK